MEAKSTVYMSCFANLVLLGKDDFLDDWVGNFSISATRDYTKIHMDARVNLVRFCICLSAALRLRFRIVPLQIRYWGRNRY